MRRSTLGVWATDGVVVDPDLDGSHPSGTGGAGKYSLGWIVEKEPHQWANFIYQAQTSTMATAATHGLLPASYVSYKVGSVSWYSDRMCVVADGRWHESFATYSYAEATGLLGYWSSSLTQHKDNRQNPHENTAIQVGTIPSVGGVFTGEVNYSTILRVVGAVFYSPVPTRDVFVNAQGKGFVAKDVASYTNGTNIFDLYLDNSFLEHDLEVERLFVTPQPDAIWELVNSPYALRGVGELAISEGEVIFNQAGLLLESGKQYLLSDLALVGTQGCLIAKVNGVAIRKVAPLGTTDLLAVFGAGNSVANIKIWCYKLTEQQFANALASE